MNIGVNTGNYWYTSIIQVGSAATWQYYTFTVPPPPNGATTATGNVAGVYLYIGGASNNNVIGTPGSWTSPNGYTFSGATNIFLTAGAYIKLTGVQLEKGTVATPFEFRPYATELAMCMRYYEQSYEIGVAPGTNTSNGYVTIGGISDSTSTMYPYVKYAVPKRAQIVPTFYTTSGTLGSWTYIRTGPATGPAAIGQTSISTTSFTGSINIGATYTAGIVYGHWVANAEL
jgi:hypothetical protein